MLTERGHFKASCLVQKALQLRVLKPGLDWLLVSVPNSWSYFKGVWSRTTLHLWLFLSSYFWRTLKPNRKDDTEKKNFPPCVLPFCKYLKWNLNLLWKVQKIHTIDVGFDFFWIHDVYNAHLIARSLCNWCLRTLKKKSLQLALLYSSVSTCFSSVMNVQQLPPGRSFS